MVVGLPGKMEHNIEILGLPKACNSGYSIIFLRTTKKAFILHCASVFRAGPNRYGSGWWFQIFFMFTPNLGEVIQFWLVFFKGLVQPQTRNGWWGQKKTSFGPPPFGRSKIWRVFNASLEKNRIWVNFSRAFCFTPKKWIIGCFSRIPRWWQKPWYLPSQ